MSDNALANYFNKKHRSQSIDGLYNGATEKFKAHLKELGIDYLDDETIHSYRQNINIVRQEIIQHIINRYLIQIEAFYLSINAGSLEAHAITSNGGRVFYIDELLEGFILDYLFMCVSVAYDDSEENVSFVSKQFSRLCKDYILNRSFPLYEEQRLQDTITYMSNTPEAGNHHAANFYWCIVTFLMGHEIYHLLETSETVNKEELEIMADNFGCRCLADLIIDAQNNKVSDSYNAFDTLYYMAPYLFFEIYIFINKYSELHGLPPVNKELFFKRRDNADDEMFKNMPEHYNLDMGNDLLNIMLDAGEVIQNRVLGGKEK